MREHRKKEERRSEIILRDMWVDSDGFKRPIGGMSREAMRLETEAWKGLKRGRGDESQGSWKVDNPTREKYQENGNKWKRGHMISSSSCCRQS